MPAMLGPVLFASYGSRHDLKDACGRWSKCHAKECGTGFFGVKLDGWGHAGRTRGDRGYVRCRVRGCGWHLKMEEADAGVDSEGNPLVLVCVYLATILESYPSELVDALEALGQITRQVEAKILSDRSAKVAKKKKKKKTAPPAPPAMTTGVTPDVGESAPTVEVEDDAEVTMETFGENPDEVHVRNPTCPPAPGRIARARKKKANPYLVVDTSKIRHL